MPIWPLGCVALWCEFNSIFNSIFARKLRRKTLRCWVSTTNLQRHLTDAHKVQTQKKKPTGTDLKKFFTAVPRPRGSSNRKNLLARDFVLWLARDLLPFSLVDGAGLQVMGTITMKLMFKLLCLTYRVHVPTQKLPHVGKIALRRIIQTDLSFCNGLHFCMTFT